MTIQNEKLYRILFLVAAIYDIVLGVIFTVFYRQAFTMLGIEDALPEYSGYMSLIGAFLFVIGVAYYLIYRGDFQYNVDLIAVGTLYKLAYFLVAVIYFAMDAVPHMAFFWVFGVADFIFLILMYRCWRSVRRIVVAL